MDTPIPEVNNLETVPEEAEIPVDISVECKLTDTNNANQSE